ncbi:MAG: ABC transporter permease, partial [Lachnospiraceae bacterium]
LNIHSFIATLGMQFVLKGAMYIYTGGEELSIGKDYALSDWLNSNPIPFLPFSAYFLITTVAIFAVMVVLRYTRLGRNIYMVGGNLETAWLAGIKSGKVNTLAFVISSGACALGGALNGIYSGTAGITMGEKGISPLMIALTATIIGGTAIYGGKGSVVWTWASLIAIALLKSICKKTELQVLVIAAILIACIVYETIALYRRNKVVGTRPNLHKEYLQEVGKAQ